MPPFDLVGARWGHERLPKRVMARDQEIVVPELQQLRDENRRLKGFVADLTLDKNVLQEAPRKKW